MPEWLGLSLPETPTPRSDLTPSGSVLGLRAPEVDAAVLGNLFGPQGEPAGPPPTVPYFSPSQNKYYIGGRTIDADDAQALLEAEQVLGQPDTTGRPQGDWLPISNAAFARELESIKQPGLGKLFSKGFGRGIDTMQLLGGRALQLVGAEETGAGIVAQQMEDLRRDSPYQRQFSNIESGGDALDYVVSMLGEQAPNLLLGVATGGLGALGGRALSGVATKQALRSAVSKKVAGQALTAAENKLIRYTTAGALVGNASGSYPLLAGEFYDEFRQQGVGPEDVDARVLSLLGAVPATALELIPEVGFVGRILGKGAGKALPAGASVRRKAGEFLKRGAVGGAVGAAAEGGTEAAQESLILGLTGQDLSDPENVTRLIESFAAGATVGGAIGIGTNLLAGREPADLLGSGNPEPQPGQLELPLTGGGERFGPQRPFATMPSAPTQAEMFPGADLGAFGGSQMELPFGAPLPPGQLELPLTFRDESRPEGPQLEFSFPGEQFGLPFDQAAPPVPIGTQGELNLIGGRGVAPAVAPLPPVAAPAPSTEIQDVLPFESGLAPRYLAPTAPTEGLPPLLGANPLLRSLQRQAEFEAAQAAVPPTPGVSPLDQRLAESQPFLDVMGTEGRLVPDVTYGTTPAVAAEEWRALAGRGRPKAFANFLPEIQNQWIDALNMAQAGELTRDDLKTIRTELVRAENKARLSRSTPDVVVTGTITPVPPKGGKARALKKPKATPVAPSKQAGTRGETLKRPVAKQAAKPAGKPVTEPKEAKKETAEPVQKEQGKAVQAVTPAKGENLKKGEEKKAEPAPVKAEPTYTSAEEAWDDMKPAGALGLKALPKQLQVKWRDAVATDKASMEEATLIYGQVDVGPKQAVREAVATIDEATDQGDTFWDAVNTLVEYAFFTNVETNTKEAIATAQAKLERENFTDAQWRAIKAAFVEQANDFDKLSATITSANAKNKGEVRPWVEFAADNDLFIKIRVPITNTKGIDPVLVELIDQAGPLEPQPAVTKKATYESKPVLTDTALSKLAALLASNLKVFNLERPFTFSQTNMSKEEYPSLPFALKDLYVKTNEADRDVVVNGYRLRDYFTADGEAKFEKVGDLFTPSAKKEDEGRFALSAFNQPDRADPAVGKLRMAVSRFVSKLATKPKVSVFKNQADMKAKNPALYRQAVAARPEGDFDTALAAGYSFGDGNVVIFTDRIANEQHLNFVLAHETVGHFGLRGIIPANKFNATMEAIYKASPAIRSDVDIAVANGQSKAEAVEEYLSDFAAVLDTSVVARVWNAIKGALNKLGIKFGDEMVRYILKQSRSYVRSGKSSMFDAAKVFTDLQDVEYGKGYASTGRFSLTGDLRDDNRVAVEIVRERTGFGQYKDPGVAWGEVKGQFGNAADFFDKFKQFFLSLANFRSLENLGLYRYNEIVKKGQDIISFLRVSSDESNAEILDASDDVKAKTSKLLYAGLDFAISKITDVRTLKGAPLFSYVDGVLKPNQPEIDKLTKQGMLEFSQAKNGVTYEVIDPDGKPRTEKFAGIPDLTEDSLEWKGYLSLRETVNQLALRLLAVKYENATATQNFALKRFSAYTEEGSGLTQQDALMFRRIVTRYSELKGEDMTLDDRGYPMMAKDAMDRAEKLLEFTNKSILSKGKASDLEQVAAAFKGAIADDVVAQLRDFAKRAKLNEQNKFAIQDELRRLGGLAFGASAADTNTRRTLATGYTPLLRPGSWQIRMEGVDAEGNPVVISDAYRSNILYMHVGTQSEAVKTETKLNDIFKDTVYEVEVYDANSGDYVKKKVKLRAKAEVSLDAVTGPTYINYSEFLYGIEQLGIRLTPAEMERVTIAMTKQTSPARKRGLQRERVPGADDDGVTAVSNYVDKTANTIGKESMRPELSDLMNLSLGSSRALWDSNPILDSGARELDVLKAAAAIPSPDGRPTVAQKEYARLKYMYEKTNPKGKPKRANQYYNEAARAAALLDGSQNVSESDFESGAVASQIRAYTSLIQLAGSIATGALNLITPYTNTIPFLASYNPATGFGGGFGAGPAVREFHRAMRHVGVRGATGGTAFNTATFYDAVAKSKDLQIKYGLAAHEADFIAREIREGVMIPAQSNALLNTARGRSTSRFWRKFSDLWMTPFNVTEQATRRAAGLAAYRLEYERQIANGKSEAKAKDAARRFAVEAIDLTMGDYGVNNRPPAFRSGIQTFLYMYKVYPTVVIQLYSNLSRNGKLGMLLGLFILSGLQGLPFAEDLEDLIDTLAQALGFKSGSIRMEIAQAVDSIFPGMSPYFLQGMVNSWMPADIAGRVSVGNVLPGTGILLSGADVGRELVDIAGPAPSALIGSAKSFADLMRAPFSDRIQLVDVAREAPVTMLRASGDAVAYAKSDAIVDRRGYVVADDANAGVIAARLLGFYPQAAAEQYSAIRIATRVTDYQRDVVAGFRQAWIKATMEGNADRAREIEQAVDSWNKGAKDTGLEIADFRKRSMRALKEAQRPAKERTLRTVPKAGREDIERAFDTLSY